ncbi:MAG TPA: SHOCT domain-containing protein [Candidatus Saccharimonadales bacterium]
MGPRFRMGRRRGLLVGAAVGASVASSRAKSQAEESNMESTQVEQQPQAAPAAMSTSDQFAELEKLGQLRDQGILTDAEFDAKKKQILGI